MYNVELRMSYQSHLFLMDSQMDSLVGLNSQFLKGWGFFAASVILLHPPIF